MLSDADCYRSYLNGDDDAFREIIDRYHNSISLYINSIVKDICAAEEIMQNTFVKLAVNKPVFKGKSSFKTWVFTIARNNALDWIKHRSRYADQSIDECFGLSDEMNIENLILKNEQNIAFHNAMKKLNSDYYQVLYLMYFEEFDTAETAIIMHKTSRQIGDLIYRAKKSLKTELEKAGFEYEKY